VSAPADSSPELLTLHAVRLKGMADDAEVAARFGLDLTLARELLLDFQAFGWITRVEFVGTAGWTLTESGRSENERELAYELAATNSNSSVHYVYLTFLPHNDRLLRACTDWQMRPSGADPLAVNDHTDQKWDQRVLTTLSTLSEQLRTICQELGQRLARFQGYDDRFTAALARVEQGELSWGARPKSGLLPHGVDGTPRRPDRDAWHPARRLGDLAAVAFRQVPAICWSRYVAQA
jgi:hypothetical protein